MDAELAPALMAGRVDDLWLPRTWELGVDGRPGWWRGTVRLRVHARGGAEARAHLMDEATRITIDLPGFEATVEPVDDRRHATRHRRLRPIPRRETAAS